MVGDKIKKLRKDKSLTLKKLGDLVNISPSFLSDIENNRTQPSLSRLIDISRELGVSICQLLAEPCKLHEDSDIYIPEKDICDSLIGDEYSDIRNELKDICNWSQEDRDELLSYLKAKRLARENTKSK